MGVPLAGAVQGQGGGLGRLPRGHEPRAHEERHLRPEHDFNTQQINAAKQSLEDLKTLTNVQIDNNDYTYVPDGRIWIHEAWSGDMAAAESYLPKGTPVEVVGYWFPADGKGPVGNDTMTVLKSGQEPGPGAPVP